MARPTRKTLLQGGTLLIHDANGTVIPRVADLLIEDGDIAQIDDAIEVDSPVKIINCSSKIVSPGFISTHHHLWQTQMKGRHGNDTLLKYLPSGCYIGTLYSVEDAFWGQLSGALESIDAGTTTVVDHAHLSHGPEIPPTLIQALETSGLRAVFCQTVPRAASPQNPLEVSDDYSLETALSGWKKLAVEAPFAEDRVQLGFAIDNMYLPTSHLQELYAELRSRKAKLITTHAASGVGFGDAPSVLQLLHRHGVLGPDILISHGNNPRDGDAELFAKQGGFVSTTPNTELQMGWPPIALKPEFEPHASLGIDCHSWGTSSIPYQMRILLQHARTERTERLAADGKWSRVVRPTYAQVFNLSTLGGARAIGMEGRAGQIKVGAKADLVVFDATSPSMLVAAQQDPVAAIVLHSSERDVETVIVDGIVRKEGGKLLPVSIAKKTAGGDGAGFEPEGREFGWAEIVKNVLESRKRVDEKAAGLDFKAVEERVIDGFHLNRETLIEKS